MISVGQPFQKPGLRSEHFLRIFSENDLCGFWLILVNFGGFLWILVDFGGFRRIPEQIRRFYENLKIPWHNSEPDAQKDGPRSLS